MSDFFLAADPEQQKRERNKARELRAGQWWKNQVGRGQCYYCHARFHPSELTMDHKTPIARGGRSTKNNLVPACKDCNNEKKHRTLSEWIAEREAEGRRLSCAEAEWY